MSRLRGKGEGRSVSAPLSRKAPPDGGLAERGGEMGRKPALHSSCSKTGAKVGISMLIDKHCQLKSCNPCQPTRACMPHWAARRPQQAHGSPGSEDDSYAPTHDDPRLTDERLKKTPTPTTVPHPANPKRNNHRTWTPECLWACDKEAVQFGHRAQQRAVHIPLSHIQQGESLVPAKLITPHRGDYGYDIIPAHQKRPASDKASFFRRTWFGPATVIPTTSTQNY